MPLSCTVHTSCAGGMNTCRGGEDHRGSAEEKCSSSSGCGACASSGDRRPLRLIEQGGRGGGGEGGGESAEELGQRRAPCCCRSFREARGSICTCSSRPSEASRALSTCPSARSAGGCGRVGRRRTVEARRTRSTDEEPNWAGCGRCCSEAEAEVDAHETARGGAMKGGAGGEGEGRRGGRISRG